MKQTRTIRWLIAHEPVELFLRTAQAFKQKLAELTDNEFDVEIYTAKEYAEKFGPIYNEARTSQVDPMSSMELGDLEMSQLHISELARWHNTDFFALELPFLFRDHDHAARVLEGEIGQNLLNSLNETSPATGLAFTYSGGFRCIAAQEKITSLEQLKGRKYATNVNPVMVDTIEALGAIPETFTIKDFIKKVQEEGYTSEALETTIPRYKALFLNSNKKHLLNTKHNLFLTSVVASNQFLSSLTDQQRQAINDAVLYASRLERQWSVQEAEEFAAKGNHNDIGVTYCELTEEETEKFKQLVKPIYEKYKDFFYPGLVDGIIKS
jgi:TRAP-type C4-dicarboxylate transport system substrate-binding protein